MAQTKQIDNVRVHMKAGTLSIEASSRWRPRQAVIAKHVDLVKPRVYLQWPYAAIDTVELRSILLAKAYSYFYNQPLEELSPFGMMSGIASMLTNLLDPLQVSRDGQLQAAFEDAGMELRYIGYRTEQDVLDLLRDPRVIRFLELFKGDNRLLYEHHRDQQLVCVGIILLTMGKGVNPDNYDGWIKNRIKTFCGALGIMPERCCWTEAQCPSQEALATSYSFLSASFSLRRLLFQICVCAARDHRRLSSIFREVLMFLQGVEMGHIIMIDRYIFAKYPELLRIRSLRDNMEAMNNAWTYLASLDPGERYFAKILYTKDETAALNRNNFSLLATAAVAAAQFETPSMRFYQGGNVTGTTGAIVDVVKQYLSLRMNLTYRSIMESPYAYMSEDEKRKYTEQAETVAAGASLFEIAVRAPALEEAPIPRPTR